MVSEETDVQVRGRVLVHAPVGRDGALTGQLLTRASIPHLVCGTLRELAAALAIGAGAVLLTEEALDEPGLEDVIQTIEDQPPWSDVPVLVCAGSERERVGMRTLQRVRKLGNVTLLDRPIRVAAVLSSVESALRSRARQYELREVLVALHEAREQADATNRVKDEFLATLSHELRTPLNAMLGWLSMLRSGQVHGPLVARAYEIIERNARAQHALVADLLDVSRIITGKLALNPTTAAVVPLLMAAVDTIAPTAAAKRIDVRTQIESADAIVIGDSARLQQVFWNLLSNAVKFTPAGGRIVVDARAQGDQVIVSVSDTGIGIDPSFLPSVFDRFRQADSTTTRTHGGLGLGLAIVRHIIELHGGRIEACSEGEGRGAKFVVSLPQVHAHAAAWPIRPLPVLAAASDPANLRGVRALVVDDDPDARELLGVILREAGAIPALAGGAAEALALIASGPPFDVVISDIAMPQQDGYSLIAAIRAARSAREREVLAIAFTAYASQPDEARARQAGFDAFLAKPIEPYLLTRTLGNLLRRPHARAHRP
jgi:signal transduction histidine kinase/ActR/RegA family two-component response regulator